MRNKLNNMPLGIVVGLILPFIVLILFVLIGGFDIDWDTVMDVNNLVMISPMLRLSLIINLIFFIPYGNRPKNQFLKGLIISTLLYGALIVFIHFQ